MRNGAKMFGLSLLALAALAIALSLTGRLNQPEAKPVGESHTTSSLHDRVWLSPSRFTALTEVASLPTELTELAGGQVTAPFFSINVDFGDSIFTSPKPAGDELTEAERRLIWGFKLRGTVVVIKPLATTTYQIARFTYEKGRLPASLEEVFPALADPNLERKLSRMTPEEILTEYGHLIDPIEGDLLVINPPEPEPGALYIKQVDDPRLWNYIGIAFAGGNPRDTTTPRPTPESAAAIWFRLLGEENRIIAEGVEVYWPDEQSMYGEAPGTGRIIQDPGGDTPAGGGSGQTTPPSAGG